MLYRSVNDLIVRNPDLFESEEEKQECRDLWMAIRFIDAAIFMLLLVSVLIGGFVMWVGPVVGVSVLLGVAATFFYLVWRHYRRSPRA